MHKTYSDAEAFYDGKIPEAVSRSIPSATPTREDPAITQQRIARQIESLAAEARSRSRQRDEALIAAAEAGKRGIWHGSDWLACIPARVAEARARLAKTED
jgi:hypothetical protein